MCYSGDRRDSAAPTRICLPLKLKVPVSVFFLRKNLTIPSQKQQKLWGQNILIRLYWEPASPWCQCFWCVSAIMPLQNIIRDTAAYAGERMIFGQPVLHNQTVHFRLAELETEVEALRSLIYRAVGEYISLIPLQIARCMYMCGYRCFFWVIGNPPYGCLQFFFACWFAQGPATIWIRSWNSCTKPPPPSECTKPPLLNPGSAPDVDNSQTLHF